MSTEVKKTWKNDTDKWNNMKSKSRRGPWKAYYKYHGKNLFSAYEGILWSVLLTVLMPFITVYMVLKALAYSLGLVFAPIWVEYAIYKLSKHRNEIS